jgi:DNA invertase Pin-like site-specific DNA recombinase
MKPLAYSYIRFSHPDQAKGHSYERQREKCLAYCRDNGLELAKGADYTFLDAGRSAWLKGEHLGEKGQLARFLSLVEAGTIPKGSTLIVESLDRLSREGARLALPLFLSLLNCEIRVVTLADGRTYEPESPNAATDLIYSIFVFARANEESNTKALRLSDKFAKKRQEAAEGKKPMGNVCPMWLKLSEDKSRYEEIPEHANTVRRIFDLAVQGYGKQAIARVLNSDNVPSLKEGRTRHGVKGWGVSGIHYVLKNRSVLGEGHPKTRTTDPKRKKRSEAAPAIVNYFPAVVSEDLFLRAQQGIASRRKDRSTKQTKRFNFWQKVAKCIHCGAAMHIVNKGKEPKSTTYLECSLGRKFGEDGPCPSHKLIRLDDSERLFKLLLVRLDSMALVKDSGAKISKAIEVVEGRLVEATEKHSKLKMLLDYRVTTDLVDLVQNAKTAVDALEEDRRRLMAELATEDAIGFDNFMERLDLESFTGRSDANMLLRRLEVVVHCSREGFMVSEKGTVRFGVGCQNVGTDKRWKAGPAGYYELSPWVARWRKVGQALHEEALAALKAAGPLHFVMPAQAGWTAFAAEEEADLARVAALDDEGTPLIDVEAAQLTFDATE